MNLTFPILSAILLTTISVLASDAPQVPTLQAVSLQRGSVISRSNSSRIIGNVNFTSTSKATTRIAAVKVTLRSFSVPKTPYEVQCFFCAKTGPNGRYVFDVQRVLSTAIFDEINIFGRDLFGGSEAIDKSVSRDHITGTTQYGDQVSGTLTTTVKLTTTRPGSKFEGWIVRVISSGKVVRMDASLYELKEYALRESALLDSVAAEAATPQP